LLLVTANLSRLRLTILSVYSRTVGLGNSVSATDCTFAIRRSSPYMQYCSEASEVVHLVTYAVQKNLYEDTYLQDAVFYCYRNFLLLAQKFS